VIAFEVLAHQEDAITHVDTKEQEIQVVRHGLVFAPAHSPSWLQALRARVASLEQAIVSLQSHVAPASQSVEQNALNPSSSAITNQALVAISSAVDCVVVYCLGHDSKKLICRSIAD
jgi:hypothetical protein